MYADASERQEDLPLDNKPCDPDDTPVSRPMAPTFAELVAKRLARRQVLKGIAATGLAAGPLPLAVASHARSQEISATAPFSFSEIARGVDETHHIAPDHQADVLLKWGDPIFEDTLEFDPLNQTVARQLRQFGYNNDFIGFIPLPGRNGNPRGLLCVNHEYAQGKHMFPKAWRDDPGKAKQLAEIALAAHGGAIVEIHQHVDGTWKVDKTSPYNRRISALETRMTIKGPAAGHPRLKTNADPTGTKVIGTLSNCAGGITPWGTYLMAEENFNFYFSGTLDPASPEAENFHRLGLPRGEHGLGDLFDRFNVAKEPNEANRFGWVVEVDPFKPDAAPKKRTALGRFKHEGCENALTVDGRLVIYSGDDQKYEHLYKFVSTAKVDGEIRENNADLLDDGTLFVAKFDDDGTGTWIPLTFGEGPLTPENGFLSQADILIDTRLAAGKVQATPLDRPEDVEPHPSGRVFVALTNNNKRRADEIDAINPRAANLWGQIVELTPERNDHAADRFTWELLVTCGNPNDPETEAEWNENISQNGWFVCPDNLAVDPQHRLWVATDQGKNWNRASGNADGLWGLDIDGAARGTGHLFFRAPVGAEVCGPRFTPDGETLFLAVQHPGADGTENYQPFNRKASFEDPVTRWPAANSQTSHPPRPAVLAIRKRGGGPVGG